MKRTLLGIAALTSIVGLGAAGVFFAKHLRTSDAEMQSVSDEGPAMGSRDATPAPIPLAGATRDDAGSQPNPFAQARASRAQRVAVADDRYSDERRRRPAERSDGDDPNINQLPPRDDEEPAARSGDPFGLSQRPAGPSFDEQPATAEISEDLNDDASPREADNAGGEEPRRLTPPAAADDVDRFGRPKPAVRGTPEPADAKTTERTEDASSPQEPPQKTLDPPLAVTPDVDPPAAEEGTGRPGEPQLSGAQAPMLAIEKSAPSEVQIGKPARFVVKVRNAGAVVAHEVEVRDTVPKGTQLIDTSPPAKRGPQGALIWELGPLKPGEEQKVEVQLMPTAEGEIGSVATVHFHAQASVRTLSTKPMLNMEVSGPAKVMKGQPVNLKIRLSNPGTGAATGLVLSEQVPEGLSHPSGKELELDIGTLKPGESREVDLALVAAAPGQVTNVLVAQGDGNLQAEARAEIEVVAPQLQVSMSGPKRRYLERNATHNISVSNPGTAAAKDIELVAVLPKELKFVEANNGGQFDAATHSVYWSLEELPPRETGTVTLTTLPQQPGDAKLLIKTMAKSGLKDQREEVVAIDGLAAINFQLSDVTGPVEVGGQASYEVRVANQGSKAATNVRLVAQLPSQMKAISADGPVRYKIEGQHVVFEPLKQLAPKGSATFTFKAQASAAGDLRVQVQLATDEIREPITKEESTRVFGDE